MPRPRLLPPPGAVRTFAFVNLVSTVGTGLWLTGSVLFFTRGLGFGIGEVGLGLTVGTIVGLAVMVPLGRLGDRIGPKPVYVGLLAVQALATALYVSVNSYAAFLVIASVAAIADRGVNGTVGAFIHAITPGRERVQTRAYLRSITNIGVAAGTALGAAALQVDTRTAYAALVLGAAVLFGSAALLLLAVPVAAPSVSAHSDSSAAAGDGTARLRHRRAGALGDKAFLAVVVTNGMLALHYEILGFAVPLWVATRADVPRWMVSVVLVTNTVLVVLLQVRVARTVTAVSLAPRALRRAGLAVAAGCLALGAAGAVPRSIAVVMVLVFAVVYSFGEMWHASGEFSMSFELAPDDAQGDYQAVFALGRSIGRAAAPTVLALVLVAPGMSGWIVAAAAVFALAMLGAWTVGRAVQLREVAETPARGPSVVVRQAAQ